MPRTNADNRRALGDWASRAHADAAIAAVRAGQAVFEEGLRRRCPSRSRAGRKLLRSIHATEVGGNAHFVGGFVVVGSPMGSAAEKKHPFVAPTFRADGPRAAEAMLAELRRGIS